MTLSATVLSPLVVAGMAPLNFGVVVPGTNTTIAATNASSGRMSITGMNGNQIAITFTLPSTLSSGVSTMPINNYSLRLGASPSPVSLVSAAVTSGVPITVNSNVTTIYVFLGGRVQPVLAQPPGTYTGAIILAAALTGL